ncbi:MAG: ABC transporter substrate-binding protein [Acidobacteria bacterium]|nr:ABC transporter substrate-binding protein [Acidobacteriota bacterium]
MPLYVASSRGMFAGERLRVSLVEARDADAVTAALGGGQCNLGAAAFDQVLRSGGAGKPLTAFLLMSRSPMLVLVSAGFLPFPRGGAKSGKVAVGRRGDASELFAHYVSEGIAVPKGGAVGAAAAFRRRETAVAVLDAAAVNELEARRAPVEVLADTRTLAGLLAVYGVSDYPASCVYAAPEFLPAHEDQARRFARAVAQAAQWIRAHDAASCVQALPESASRGVDADALAMTVEQARALFSVDGALTMAGAEAARKALAASDERFREGVVPPESSTRKYVDPRP